MRACSAVMSQRLLPFSPLLLCISLQHACSVYWEPVSGKVQAGLSPGPEHLPAQGTKNGHHRRWCHCVQSISDPCNLKMRMNPPWEFLI